MIGPSSSHTAGAVRLGLLARRVWSRPVKQVDIYLRGSFAATYWGHGTDKGIVGGLMGMAPDDLRIPTAFELAEVQGLTVRFHQERVDGAHPNSARLVLHDETTTMEIIGASVGGGAVMLQEINGFAVNVDGLSTTLVVAHRDQPGIVALIADRLALLGLNIASMSLTRKRRGQDAVAVLSIDGALSEEEARDIESSCPKGSKVILIQPLEED